MAPTTSPKSTSKKEKVFHPSSRKAGQLARKALRKGRLTDLSAKRGHKDHSVADFFGFWFHAIPDEGVLSLDDIHQLIQDVWLVRFDEELEIEKAARRKGRPQSTKELKLEEIKLQESELYRTGMEIPDLTHPPTVELYRRWDQKEVPYLKLLRFIRISSSDPQNPVVSKPGKHYSILKGDPPQDSAMDIVET
ncbi:hypothetical protein BDN72DRAFT_837355 [Pluteus cervinus]|uniref:Uncharacterized protein n=1 Tax=Pluteus cervinus TaxID=181527 RepID=A0ACD3B0X3_9AGAR|nr:hypothetical protein BDN72DRAFT_837355 [Pluteus cervinus]